MSASEQWSQQAAIEFTARDGIAYAAVKRMLVELSLWGRGATFYEDLQAVLDTKQMSLQDLYDEGRMVMTAEAATHLGIRRSDFDHLVRAGLVRPARWARSSWPTRGTAAWTVALYLVRDLDNLAADPAIDWAAVCATPKGRASLLASLPTATNTNHNGCGGDTGNDRSGGTEDAEVRA